MASNAHTASNGEHANCVGQTPQDVGLSTGSQSAITAYDRMLQEKERVIRESIAAKYSKIHEVERQLESLRLALHVNVGPRRQALELLRSKIEAQNHKIDQHRTDYRKYKQLAEQALAAMEREEALKNQMAEELNTLVQQSAGAQLKKLDELGQELEHLTAGLPFTSAANGGGAGVASDAAAPEVGDGSQVDAMAAAFVPPPGSSSEGQQEGQPRAGHAGAEGAVAAGDTALQEQHTVAEEQRRRQEEAERLRQRLAEQQKAAADARSRHVQLGGRRPGPSLIPPAPAGNNGSPAGPFRGFD